jgi:hydroxyacylglutathione hydrolase
MRGTLGQPVEKQNQICVRRRWRRLAFPPVPFPPTLPLEDELGDVLEKAMRRAGVTGEQVAARARVPLAKILDAIDYRPDLSCDELRRIAAALRLNEVGLCALGSGRYPKPEIGALPFCVWPLQMPHGIGVANAYIAAECGASHGLLFDTGAGIDMLESGWPRGIRQLDAVFLTHVEAEHAGGLCDVVERFGAPAAFIPVGAKAPCGRSMGEGETRVFGAVEVTAFATPGHAAAHNCYLVCVPQARTAPALLVSGDLVFAGSVGGAYFSHDQLQSQLRRILAMMPPATIIAPGHGPMTTVENELRFNPFAV